MVELLGRYRSGLIAIQANPSVDGLAAATALYLALTKMNKNVSLVCSQPPQNADLVGTDKIQNTLSSGGNHLVISFPYQEGSIDKVDYNIQGDQFNLIIVPNSDTNRIDPNEVKFSYTGGKIEFIITVDVPNLNSLGPIYTENQNEFQSKNIINIDRHLINNSFGTINILNKQASATSEMVFQIIRELQVELDTDIATNLYTGLLSATNNFSSYSVGPTTFEAAAQLMKYGAAAKKQSPPGQPGGGPMGMPMPGMPPVGGNQGGTPPSPFGGGGAGNGGPFAYGGGGNTGANPFAGGNPFAGQNPFAPPSQGPSPMQSPPQQNQQNQPPRQQSPMNQPQSSQPQPQMNQSPQQQNQLPQEQRQPVPSDQNQQQSDQQPPQSNQQQNHGPQNQQNQPPQQNQGPQNQQNQPRQQNQQNQQQPQSPDQPQQQNSNPQDWLKPKLFRGSNLM